MDLVQIDGNELITKDQLIAYAKECEAMLQHENIAGSDLERIAYVGQKCITSKADQGLGFKIVELAAFRGNALAQFYMGNNYFYGRIGEPENEKALHWFELAAEQGEAGAINNLGEFYLHGYGCEKDENKAYELIRKAADMEEGDAYEGMGYCYYFGAGVGKDAKLAQYWWEKAAACGNYMGHENLIKHFGFRTEDLSIEPYEILKNAFNTASFEGFIPMLCDDAIYTSLWHKSPFIGKNNIEKHLLVTSNKVMENNVVTTARVAKITNKHLCSNDSDNEIPGYYCVVIETERGTAVVLLEGRNNLVSRMSICKPSTVNYEFLETPDLMTREEIHCFGIDVVCEDMEKEGYRIVSVNLKLATFPQIQAEKEGLRYIVIVETEVAPFMGKKEESDVEQIIQYAKIANEIPCFASVGIGSSHAEHFNKGITKKAEGYYVNYLGLEFLGISDNVN